MYLIVIKTSMQADKNSIIYKKKKNYSIIMFNCDLFHNWILLYSKFCNISIFKKQSLLNNNKI